MRALLVALMWLIVMVIHWLKLRPDRIRATVEAERAYRLALKGEHIDEFAYERRHRATMRIGQIGSTLAMAGALTYIAIAQPD